MRANIERLAEGKFEYEQVRLVIEEERIERTVYENEVVNGSFHISCPDNKKVKGIVYAGNRRVHCLNPQFIAKEAEIHYSYDSRGLTEGEKTEGEFVIVSSAGEFTLPFCFDVSKAYMESSLGVIKNLFHFANLARSSWQEAYKIFCKREFLSVIENTEKKLVSVYRGLTEGGITEAAMEEFLISIRKKDRLFVSLDKQQEVYENVTESFKKNLMLMKSGWGFMEVRITSDADFLIPEQTVVHSEDFVGSQYIFEYIIESSKLHAGKNFGRLIFETDYSRTEFTVEVSKGSTRELPKERILVRRHERELFEKYILFRGRKIGTKEWTRMSLELLEQLGSMGAQTPWHELMRVQLYLVEKRMDEADWILERFEQTRRLKNQNPELYGYYLYIQVLRKKEQASKAAEHIQSLLKK